jgi:hypothetical protein
MGLTEFLYFEAALLIGSLLTVGVGMLALPAAYFRAARWCFIIAATGFAGIGVMWGLATTEPLVVRVLITGLLGFVAASGLTEALRLTTHLETKVREEATAAAPAATPAPPEITIGVICSWSQPPTHYRDDRTLYMVDFQGIPVTGLNPGQQIAGPMSFIRSSEPFKGSVHHTSWNRCDITNYSTQPVRDILLLFPTAFLEPEKTENGYRSGKVLALGYARAPMIDLAGGATDYFYFANASPAFVQGTIPPTAMLQTLADDTMRAVKVLGKGEINPGFNLMPSTNPLGQPPPVPMPPSRPTGK